MSAWLSRSSVPGMSVPGMAVPALDGASGSQFQYVGPYPLCYLDYLDVITRETLSVVPGGSYSMIAVNSRAGLTVPPPDHRWLGANGMFALRPAFRGSYLAEMAVARAHTAALHAKYAARTGTPQPSGGMQGARTAPPPSPPSEYHVAMAVARAHTADLHARRARGEPVGC